MTILVALGACGSSSSGEPCTDGATQSCSCEGGDQGLQTCSAGSFGACSCADASSPGDRGGLKGRIFDADTGRALDQVQVKTQSGSVAKTDERGNFELSKASGQVEISHTQYAPTVRNAPAKGGYMEVFIKDLDETVEIDATKGERIELKSGAALVIPGGAVRDPKGTPVKGKVKVSITYVNGKERKQATALPGNLEAEAKGGKSGRVAIEAAMDITIQDKKGKRLTVGAEDDVVAEFPIKGAAPRFETKGFSFNEAKGKWEIEELSVKRVVNEAGQRVYRKEIDHLSWHAFGDFFVELTCLRACVVDGAKNPLSGAQVWLVGSSFPGVSAVFTEDDGCVVADAPVSQDLVLIAQNGGGVSEAQRYRTKSKVMRAAGDPNQCDTSADKLTIGEEPPSSCPAGFVECDGACTDLATDPEHCGQCDSACGGTAGREESCIAGSCGCPAGTTLCGKGDTAACVDLSSDPLHCGECDNALSQVEVPQRCVGGKGQAVSCPRQADAVCDGDCIDITRNEGNCGGCGEACGTNEICLSSCVALDSPTLCTNPQAASSCEDGLFCNGAETCDPTSPAADQTGCVRRPAPCSQQQTCSEATDACVTIAECSPSTYTERQLACGFITPCLQTAIENGQFILGNLLNCADADQTGPLDFTDEFGQGYDCSSCIRNALMACAGTVGCETERNALDCCGQAHQCTSPGCVSEFCVSEFNALDSCLQTQQQGTCYSQITDSICIGG